MAIVVKAEDLDKFLENTQLPVFLRFKSSTCGHCNDMKDQWDQVARSLDDKVKVIDVEVQANIADISKHQSTRDFVKAEKGVPRMYMIHGNVVSEYNGVRNAVEMIAAMKKFIESGIIPMPGGRKPMTRSLRRVSRNALRSACRRTNKRSNKRFIRLRKRTHGRSKARRTNNSRTTRKR
jgi:thiol-disulfide isomerase/thioredoxin